MTLLECAALAAIIVVVMPFIVALYFRLLLRGLTRAVIEVVKAIKQTNLKG